MADPPESSLPPSVIEKLRELNTELAEGKSIPSRISVIESRPLSCVLYTVRIIASSEQY